MSDWETEAGDGRLVRVFGRLTMAASQHHWSPRATLTRSAAGDWWRLRCDTTQGDTSLLGWTAAELHLVPGEDFLHPDDRDELDALRCGACTGRFIPVELRILARDSRYWWTRWHLVVGPGGSCEATGLDYIRPAGAASPVATWRWNVDRDIVSWSPELLDMFDLRWGPPASLASFLASVHEDDRASVAGRLRLAVIDGEPFGYTFRCPTDGAYERWFCACGRCYSKLDGTRVVGGMVKYLNPPPSRGAATVIGSG
jgi:PAS domain-containing protein